jgi:hypothetical protein
MRPETSIVTSLDELRSLHLQRIEDERVRGEHARFAILEATQGSARRSAAQLVAMTTELEGVHAKLEAGKHALQAATDAAGRKHEQQAIDDATRAAIAQQHQLDQWHAAQAARKRQEGLHQDACVGTALGCEK